MLSTICRQPILPHKRGRFAAIATLGTLRADPTIRIDFTAAATHLANDSPV